MKFPHPVKLYLHFFPTCPHQHIPPLYPATHAANDPVKPPLVATWAIFAIFATQSPPIALFQTPVPIHTDNTMKANPLPFIARILLLLPAWMFSILVIAAILWLTLAPDPLPDNDLPLFPGFDKVGHACMFGGLYFAAAFDWSTRHRKSHTYPDTGFNLPAKHAIAIALAAIAFGGAIELIQGAMGMGRGCDIFDFLADTAGVAVSALITPCILRAMRRSTNA